MKIFVVIVLAMMAVGAFGQDAPAAPPPMVALSGNVAAGLKADISAKTSSVYAWDDNDGFPIQINTRFDFNLDPNAGVTVNFRTRGTGQSVGSSGRGIPYLNRGLVWVKALDGLVKMRTGYLWDTDYESSFNAWDTVTSLEWCSSVDFFPAPGLELGFVVPTPLSGGLKVDDALKDVMYGAVWTPSFGRVSVMAQAGSVDANRSLNFGVDFTAIEKLTLRFEGDLQQVGIDKAGYYQLFQQVNYNFGLFTPDIQVTEVLQKATDAVKVNTYTSVYSTLNGITYGAAFAFNFDPKAPDQAYKQAEVNVRVKPNAKSWVQGGAYLTMATPSADPVVSPYINFFASY